MMESSQLLVSSELHTTESAYLHLSPRAKAVRKSKQQNLVLMSLLRYGLMTYEQIEQDTGIDYIGVTKVAKRLRTRGLICNCRWVDPVRAPKRGPLSPFNVCSLTSAGWNRLLKDGLASPDAPHLAHTWEGQYRVLSKFNHDKEVVDSLIEFDKALSSQNHLDLYDLRVPTTRIKDTQNLKNKRGINSTRETLESGQHFIPDATLSMRNLKTGYRSELYFEYERKSNKACVDKEAPEKIQTYYDYYKSKDWDEERKNFILLYVCSRKERVNEVFDYKESAQLFRQLRVAHYDDVLRDPLGSIWKYVRIENGNSKFDYWSPVHG